jgi:hypothetical protein
VIPREGVERISRRAGTEVGEGHVIPREGVERIEKEMSDLARLE